MLAREPDEYLAGTLPQGRLEPAAGIWVPVRHGRGDLGQVVDEQAVRDPVPAALRVVAEGPGDTGLQRRERRVVPRGKQLGALQVAEDGLDGQPVAVHAHEDVLQVRLEHHPVTEQRVQHGRRDRADVGLPPGRAATPDPARRAGWPPRRGPRRRRVAGGSVRAAASTGVAPGARCPRSPSRTMTDRPSAASSAASVTVRYPGSPSMAVPGKRAARSAATGRSSVVSATAPASSYQEFLRTQLVIRTLRLNLQKTSAAGSYTVRTDEVGTTPRAPEPRSMSSRSRNARRSHGRAASRRSCQGCAGSTWYPAGRRR